MEIWSNIKGYPNYMISNYGNVKSLKTKTILKPYLVNSGYLVVKLINKSKRYTKYIHRLVAESFYDGDHTGLEVNHIDGNKCNNMLSNLEWCTHSENTIHAIKNGLFSPYKLPIHPHEKTPVKIIETGEVFDSLTECANHVNGVKQGISQCLNGVKKTYKGYHYERV